jgi:hypothetical protein
MDQTADTNAATWQCAETVRAWAAEEQQRDRSRALEPQEQARWENHVRYMIPLAQQLEYLRSAGLAGIDVYWKRLDHVIYGGCRPR